MADHMIHSIADLPAPLFPKLDLKRTKISYDAEGDILILLFETGKLATSVDQGEFWLRMDPITGDVYGIEIENFEAAFLNGHPDLVAAWNESKHDLQRPQAGSAREPFIRRILTSLEPLALPPSPRTG